METENYFLDLTLVKCEVEKKNGLNYISWSDWWAELKKRHPTATYTKIKNGDTYLFKSGTGWSVECEVTVNGVSHTADLAIMDNKKQPVLYSDIKSTDIQNTLQRAFAKAIAMHGIGLYVYRWEDFPEDDDTQNSNDTKQTKSIEKPIYFVGTKSVEKASFDEGVFKRMRDSGLTCKDPTDAVRDARVKYLVSHQSAYAIESFYRTGEYKAINTFPIK